MRTISSYAGPEFLVLRCVANKDPVDRGKHLVGGEVREPSRLHFTKTQNFTQLANTLVLIPFASSKRMFNEFQSFNTATACPLTVSFSRQPDRQFISFRKSKSLHTSTSTLPTFKRAADEALLLAVPRAHFPSAVFWCSFPFQSSLPRSDRDGSLR